MQIKLSIILNQRFLKEMILFTKLMVLLFHLMIANIKKSLVKKMDFHIGQEPGSFLAWADLVAFLMCLGMLELEEL
jgi:hypothetical protein